MPTEARVRQLVHHLPSPCGKIQEPLQDVVALHARSHFAFFIFRFAFYIRSARPSYRISTSSFSTRVPASSLRPTRTFDSPVPTPLKRYFFTVVRPAASLVRMRSWRAWPGKRAKAV